MKTDNTLWMGDIEPWMDELFIRNSFIECGFNPNKITLIRDKRFERKKNFCFINFNSFQETINALFYLNSKKIPKTNFFFKLNIAKNKEKFKFSKNVYIGNLTPRINDMDLYNIFKTKYPSVYYASIITDNGISRGYGFVHFSKEDEYKKCIKEMNGIVIDNRIIKISEKINNNNYYKNNETSNKFNHINNNNNFTLSSFNDESSSLDNDETNFSIQEKEQDLSLSDSSNNNFHNQTFLDNLELLKGDNNSILNKIIQEKVDKLAGYYKNKNPNQLSKILLYYCSNLN